MKKFPSVESYLNALRMREAPAVLPLQLVAKHLQVTRAAVDRMLKPGIENLRTITISGNRFVDADSIIELENARRDDVRKVREFLERLAGEGKQSVFYEPVMKLIGRDTRIPADRKYIGQVLAKISRATDEEGGILLSVLVHRKAMGRTRPGPGFFELVKSLKMKWKNDDDLVAVETAKVLRYYK